jgi:hypothetical protein
MADTSLIALFEQILGLFNLSKNGIKPMRDRPSHLNQSKGRSLVKQKPGFSRNLNSESPRDRKNPVSSLSSFGALQRRN